MRLFSASEYVALEQADSATGHGNAHLCPNTHSHPMVEVPCTTLDDFAREHVAIKIDV